MRVVGPLNRGGSILVTTYSTFQKHRNLLLPQSWHYVVLDEGHKIRNPKTRVSSLFFHASLSVSQSFVFLYAFFEMIISETVKQLHTPCRLVLSGTPLQNSLTEIWSLMDFVYTGKLNSLETFTEKFATPITQGGYANATKQQLLTAYKCATVLRLVSF
uniref:Helicase ATP-binding domain-containing protein n=1 Tax=Angiostrongylus cantonensis TaxID=6313 RepID=A0A0K0D7J0_ANGCA